MTITEHSAFVVKKFLLAFLRKSKLKKIEKETDKNEIFWRAIGSHEEVDEQRPVESDEDIALQLAEAD